MIECHVKAITNILNISQTERLLVTVLEKFAIVTNNDGTKSNNERFISGPVHKLAVDQHNMKKTSHSKAVCPTMWENVDSRGLSVALPEREGRLRTSRG